MAFHSIENADQALLDWLWAKVQAKACPDCGVEPGENHQHGCDVSQCPIHKGQTLTAPCGECDKNPCEVVWHGVWPGKRECYKLGIVTFDTFTNQIMFDLNEWHRQGCPEVD